jgi:stage II sporulation protein R
MMHSALKLETLAGQNWWCVLFPPLCFVDVSSGIVPEESKQQLDSSLSDEEFAILSSSHTSNSINLKFKLLELFSK